MGHYRSNVPDQEFLLTEVFPPTPAVIAAWEDFDPDTVHEILTEVARLAEGPLADVFAAGDRTPPAFDPTTYTVALPEPIKAAYATLMESEYWRLDLPEEVGGSAAAPSLRWAVAEHILAANPALFFYMAGPLFASILHDLGTPDQKRLAQHMVDQQWGATMVLTEPDAGSDVGAGRTTARLQPDGTWHIEGVKRFITSGDHDLADNIVHLVLARPVDVDGAGGPGTKGLSLFAVPKFHVDLDTGALGDRNGAYVTGMEHKMGLTASSTCEVSFGLNGTPAVGTLVGDTHDGIAQMFRVIEYARMMVGTKSIATLSTAYLGALDYATTRIQGSALTGGKNGPKVPIIEHPDVRRLLLQQKAYAEGMRALVFYTAHWQDRAEAARRGHLDPDVDQVGLDGVVDLLLPIVKGVGSERSFEVMTSSLQVYGGSGYLQDYPIEQHLRDSKIDSLYEGVTGVQALDLLFRKILKNQFAAWTVLVADITTRLDQVTDPTLQHSLAHARDSLNVVGQMLGQAAQWALAGIGDDPEQLNTAGFHSVPILLAAGDALIAALLVMSAQAAVDGGDSTRAAGKTAAADYFTSTVLTRLPGELAAMAASTGQVRTWMHLDPGAFR